MVTGGSRRSVRRKYAAWACALGLALVIGLCPTGYLAVGPGPVESLGPIVTIEGQGMPKESIHLVTVAASDAPVYGLLLAAFDPRTELWAKEDVLGSRSFDRYQQDNEALMAESIETAISVAFTAGIFDSEAGILPHDVSIAPGGVIGPSAGLAFALEIYARLSGEISLDQGPVVATGALDRSGRVLPIGGVYQKTVACVEQGAGLFIVPRANLAEALERSGQMRVMGVSTFKEAVEILRALP